MRAASNPLKVHSCTALNWRLSQKAIASLRSRLPMPVPRQLSSRMNQRKCASCWPRSSPSIASEPTIFPSRIASQIWLAGEESRVANSATPLATLPSKKRQSHDDGRNTPRASGLSGRSSPAGSRSSAKFAEPYPRARYPDTAPAPGHRPPVQWRQFAAASHPDGLTPPPPDGYPRALIFATVSCPFAVRGE